MKFVVSSKQLYSVISGVGKVISSKNALTILNNFHFNLEGDRLAVTGSDTENAATGWLTVSEVEGQGTFCLDMRRLTDLMKEIADQPVTFEINDENLEVRIVSPSGKYQMVALPGDQYPVYKRDDADEEKVSFVCPCKQLLRGIERSVFAVGTDDYHPQMMGILIDIKPDGITFVATDTRKMVRYIDKTSAPGVEARRILPTKPASVLKNLLTAEGEVTVETTSKGATFAFGNYVFNCRFIKGAYPDYNRVIPSNNPYTVTVDRLRFLNAIRRVGVFVDPGYGMEKFKITNDHIHIKSSDAGVLSAGDERLDCVYQGPDIVIGFSAPIMTEILNNISTEEIVVKLADPTRPGVFLPTENDENTDLLMLLMPMNVQEF